MIDRCFSSNEIDIDNFSFSNFSSLSAVREDVKSGRVPIRGVNLGGWLVAENWMTKGSPAWNGVSDDIANKGEYQTMQYLGNHYFSIIE